MSVEFKVPPGFEVLQSPKNLPPVFNGEKMVVYGVLKQKGTPGQGTHISSSAVLKGSILGKATEHSVSFTCLYTAPVEEASTLPSIHHLAGKALISDWQDEGRNKGEIVKLSVDSSVISLHTAFIAVDEESNTPVTGAMKTWDIQADFDLEEEDLLCAAAMPMSFSMGVDYLSDEDEEEDDMSLGVAWQSQSYAPYRITTFSNAAPEFNRMSPPPAVRAVTSPTSQPVASITDLSSFITIQQADGSWKLDTSLAELMGKNQKDLEEACPTECKGTMAMVWATILVLSLLRMKYSSQQEEWELVAMKAESWVKRQTLPSGVSLEELYKAAEKII